MDVKIIDCVPDNKPHCGNCYHLEDCGELFAHCDEKNEDCPSFTVCDSWHSKLTTEQLRNCYESYVGDCIYENGDKAKYLSYEEWLAESERLGEPYGVL